MRKLINIVCMAGLVSVLSACGVSEGIKTTSDDINFLESDDQGPEQPEEIKLTCGGITGAECPSGFECIEDPIVNCDLDQDPDCMGICVLIKKDGQSCGGLAGTPCPDGFECLDDTSDTCDPSNGGADCMGICHAE